LKKVHFLGIGGSGISAIAKIAEAQGFEISGCDIDPNTEFTSAFRQNQLFQGHSASHLYCHPEPFTPLEGKLREGSNSNIDSSLITQNDKVIDILAVTPAIYSLDPDNLELLEAKKKGIEILTWQEFMGKYLENNKFVIAVCGTHGKSTTTAMIGKILEDAGLDPTVELGAIVPEWGNNYRIGGSQFFVTEADEFNDNFLSTHPDITVVTTIEMDHPEYFKDFESYKKSYSTFLGQTKKTIVANLSDRGVTDVITLHTGSHSRCVGITIDYSKKVIDFDLKIPGEFNILNASAAYQVGLALGIQPEVIRQSLENFTGINRRFEKIGEAYGAQIYSDFAHHPTEIKVTLKAVREKFSDKKITVVFQPHMFSRTKALFADFVDVLKKSPVNQTYVLDIFPSREVNTGLVNTKQLIEAINQENVKYIASSDELLNLLSKEIKSGDIVIFMGAGETDKIAKELVNT